MARLGTYQAALYAAEDAVGPVRTWKDVREVRAYVDVLVASPDFQDAWPNVTQVSVERRGSGATWSLSLRHEQAILLASLDLLSVLHEVAHLCTPGDGHGPEFATALLSLVRAEVGFHAYGALRSALMASPAFRGCDLTTADLTPWCGRG